MEDIPSLQTSSTISQEYNVSPSQKRFSKKPKRFVLVGFFILFISILLFIGNIFFKSRSSQMAGDTDLIPTIAEPTEELFPTETPIPTSEPTATPVISPTTNPIDKATGLDRSSLSVAVKNGSGAVGAGSKASELLKGLGYEVVTVENADSFDYQNVTIQITSAKSEYLPLLKKDLGFSYTIGTTSATLSSGGSSDAVVIIGK